MAATHQRGWLARWLSGRALLIHLALVVSFPSCVLATWWQVHRALSGNTLSWAYTFEWPAFAGLAVWVWWVLIHLPDRGGDPAPAPAGRRAPRALKPKQAARQRLLERRRAALRWEPGQEGPRLRAYNDYLARLHGVTQAEARRIPRPSGGGRD